MSFKKLNLKLVYDNSTNEIINELVIPLLKESKEYYRGVGFFSSSWITLVTQGLECIATKRGKISLITSPILSEKDWQAMKLGEEARISEILYLRIKEAIDNEFDANTKEDQLNLLSWLIADNILDIKLALCNNEKGMYHDKLAIFKDYENNIVCLHGSFNDSLQATYNGESFSVFKSWELGQEKYIQEHLKRFENMWNNKNKFYKVVNIPEILKIEIQKYKKDKRPYIILNESSKIHFPNYLEKLYDYQEEAIECLKKNNWQGILEMATGTGKTITSIAASKEYFEDNGRIFLITVVPFKHLINQWQDNLTDFGFEAILKCYKSTKSWHNKLNSKIKDFNSKISDIECVITTYNTYSSDNFLNLTSKINEHVFFIADECHYLGSKYLKTKFQEEIKVRIGLSATPDRWFDKEGTTALKNYFKKTVFKYELERAIEDNFLCKYEYEPILVNLLENEYDEYKELTGKINQLMVMNKEEEIKKGSFLEKIIFERSKIVSKAFNKKNILIDLLKNRKKKEKIKHTLVYCAPGMSKEITKTISGLGIKVHEFVYTVKDKDRIKLLKTFDKGEIQVLVAIKCLDEGVDVPSTKTAYFLASTSNPKEFIQRRGRILRKSDNKHIAKIYDFLVLPEKLNNFIDDYSEINKSIIFKEMPRFAEFCRAAINKFSARSKVIDLLEQYNLEYLMDKRPWEIYKEKEEKYENEQFNKC